ncbi:MAG: M48 family metallopeptidase [Colwellia sp.]|nr:M48 family metallopeptidase [Colwellia sp.]
MIEYQVVRSRRKTLSLQVRYGQVLVRAPYCVDEKFITTLIDKKSAWLKAKIAQQSQANGCRCDFSQGSTLFLFGKLVTLDIIFAKQARIILTDNNINSRKILTIVLAQRNKNKLYNSVLLATAVKKQLEQYFKQQAQQMIPLKVAIYAQLTSLTPTSIKIRRYRSRWGSCNNRGELSFNYLLMMLPIEVINYVVIHELCHLEYLNHSQEFWQLVAKYFPQHVQAKQWIKINQSALQWRLSSH